jgi:alanine dehydrogenase
VDVSIEQRGCFEASRATTDAKPIFIEEGGWFTIGSPICQQAFPATSTLALNNATLGKPYVSAEAALGSSVH